MKHKQFLALLMAISLAGASLSSATVSVFASETKVQQVTQEKKMSLLDKVEQLVEEIDPTDETSILKSGYVASEKSNQLTAGDLFVTKINSKDVYYAYTEGDNALRIDQKGKTISCKYVVNDTTRYYKYQRKKPSIPSGLSAEYGDILSTVELPQYYHWENDSVKLDKVGNYECDVTYDPENDLMYEHDLKVTVEVKKKKMIIEQPLDTYYLTYTSKLTSDDISLPDGWSFEEKIINLSTGEYKVIYTPKDEEHYDYDWQKKEKIIKVDILRATPTFFTPEPITVEYESAISSYLLPTYDNGYFSFDEAGSFTKSGYYSCHFTPYDLEHYKTVDGILIYVTVLPKKQKEIPKKEDSTPVIPSTNPSQNPSNSSGSSKKENIVKNEKLTFPKESSVSNASFNKAVGEVKTGSYTGISNTSTDSRIHFNRGVTSEKSGDKSEKDIQIINTTDITEDNKTDGKETKVRPQTSESKKDESSKSTGNKSTVKKKHEKETTAEKKNKSEAPQKKSNNLLYGIGAALVATVAVIMLLFKKKKSK